MTSGNLFVVPEDIWYILPEKKIRDMWSVGLHPQLEVSKYGAYEEAWHLLRGETPATIDIKACAEAPEEVGPLGF